MILSADDSLVIASEVPLQGLEPGLHAWALAQLTTQDNTPSPYVEAVVNNLVSFTILSHEMLTNGIIFE
jgi:hypothetical protein